jgi:exodeoxyribonuclease V beta subunit
LGLESSDHGWDEHAQAFRRWHERWLKRGFIQMFHALLSDARVPARVLKIAGGERKMTNLLHLAELLHGAATTHDLHLEGLLTLMESRLAEGDDQSGDEAVELRLESDEAAVQILTVHRSKGLEFPIVFCPYLWNGFKKEAKRTHVLYHEPESDWDLTMDLGSTHMKRAKALCDEEAFAEELRLAYVALTRAKHACFVVWGHFNTAQSSPLAYLLHGSEERLQDRDLTAYVKISRAMTELQLRAELESFVEANPGLMAFEKVDTRPTLRTLDLPPSPMEIEAARYDRQEDHRWAVSSFSRLQSGDSPRGPQEDGLDHDVSLSHLLEAQVASTPIPLVDFPRGSRAGTFFHELLEHLDFQRIWQPESLELVKRTMERYNYDLDAATTVRKALAATVETSLKDGLRLFVVSRAKRIDELEFHLPISAPLRPRTLADVFREHQSAALDPSYPDRLAALSFPTLKGFLKGYIDLIFEHEGRYYLADYKSNHLGDDVEAYRQGELGKAMSHGNYTLQYHLYLLALHRFLGLRKRDYDYERDIGGVFYLFIKGMDPRRGPTHGVFYDKPSLQMMNALSAAFGEIPGA